MGEAVSEGEFSIEKLLCAVHSVAANKWSAAPRSKAGVTGHQSFVNYFSWVQSIIWDTWRCFLVLWSGFMQGVRVREGRDEVCRNCSSPLLLLVLTAWDHAVPRHSCISPFPCLKSGYLRSILKSSTRKTLSYPQKKLCWYTLFCGPNS